MTDIEKIEAVKAEMREFRQKMMRVAILKQRLADLEDDINHPSISIGGSAVRNNSISAGAARLILIKSEIEEQLKIAENDYNEHLDRVFFRMRKLPINERSVLENRYIYETPTKDVLAVMKTTKTAYYEVLNRAYVDYYDIN